MALGKTINRSEHILVKHMPAKMTTLKFREKEIMGLVGSIMDFNKSDQIIMLLGLHGVGKSSVARNTLHYIYERKYITGGILWVQLKGVRDVYSVSKHLQKYIYRSLNLTKSEINELTKETCTEEKLIEFIKEFFNNPHLPKYAAKFKKKFDTSGKKQRKFLICFDNAEELIAHKDADF